MQSKTHWTWKTPHGLSDSSEQLCSPKSMNNPPVLPPAKVFRGKNVLAL